MIYGSPSKCGIDGCENGGLIREKIGSDEFHLCTFHQRWLASQLIKKLEEQEPLHKHFRREDE